MAQALELDIVRKGFGPILDKLEEEHEFTLQELEDLLSGCEMGSLFLETLWHLNNSKLRFMLGEFSDVVDLGTQAFGAARDRVQGADMDPSERAAVISKLTTMESGAREMHRKLSAIQRWLEIPPPEVAESRLPSGRGKREA
jgi:hypothetical protein